MQRPFYEELKRMSVFREQGVQLSTPEMKMLMDLQDQMETVNDYCLKTMQSLNDAWIAERNQLKLLNRIELLEKEVERLKKNRLNAKYFAHSDHE